MPAAWGAWVPGDLVWVRVWDQDTGCHVHFLFVFFEYLNVNCFACILGMIGEQGVMDFGGLRSRQ